MSYADRILAGLIDRRLAELDHLIASNPVAARAELKYTRTWIRHQAWKQSLLTTPAADR